MNNRSYAGLRFGTKWLAGLFLLALVLPARPAGKSPGDCKIEDCKEWDEYAHDCVDLPKNCVISAWFGDDRDDGDCNSDITYNTRGVPICGSKTKTIKYQEHKSWCSGYNTYEHDATQMTYTWIITQCRPKYVGPTLAEDLIDAAQLSLSCVETLLELAAALNGLGDYPDASNVADCIQGLCDYYGYDVAACYAGCEVDDISYQGGVPKCTLLGEGCGY